MVFFFALRRHKEGGFFFCICASLFLGIITASLQREVLTKPFSFCMPGHRRLPRRFILGVGSVADLAIGAYFLGYRGLEFPHVMLVVLAAGFAGMIFYLLGVWLVFLLRTTSFMGIVGFFPAMIIILDLRASLERTIISYPLTLIAAGTLSCAFAWMLLESESLARKNCGRNAAGLADTWNTTRIRQIQRKRAAEMWSKRGPSSVFDSLGQFFLPRIRACRPFSGNRHLLGNLYILFGKLLGPQWWLQPVTLMALVLFFGYLPGQIASPLIFAFPAFGLVAMDLIPYRGTLLLGGRREKYHSALIMGLAGTLLLTLLIATMALISIPLNSVMPDIPLKGEAMSHNPIGLGAFYLCPVLAPIAIVLGTLFSRKRLALTIAIGAIMTAVLIILIVFRFWEIMMLFWPGDILGPIVLIAISWTFSALLLRYHCRRQNLVGQGR